MSKFSFAFGRKNYILLAIGVVILFLGYALMSGGGSADPTKFDPAIFSPRRITVAPLIVILGYIFVGFAILYKDKSNDTNLEAVSKDKIKKAK